MARKPRVDYPGCWHHLMHRGARREPIFVDESHHQMFLRCLGEACERTGLETHAYCLMTNHYHLFVRSPHGEVHRAMKHLNGTYSLRLNRRYGWDGPLFRDRYSNVIVADDDQARRLVAYIHLNPVKALLCQTPEDYIWSSYRSYTGRAAPPQWLKTNMVYALHPTAEELEAYTLELGAAGKDGARLDPEAGQLVSISTSFVDLEEATSRDRVETEDIVEMVSEVTGLTRGDLIRSVRGRGGNPARRMLMWALSEYAQLPHREIAALLGAQTNAVNCMLKRIQDGNSSQSGHESVRWRAILEAKLRK